MLTFSIIETGTHSAKPVQKLQLDVFQNNNSFALLYRAIHAHQLPPPVPPQVDFEDATVLMITLPEKPTTGHRVSVQSIQQIDTLLKIRLKITKPRTNMLQTPMLTQPFVILKINKATRFFSQVALFDETGRELLTQHLRSPVQ